jgi:Chaperone of endosialidase
MARLLNYNEAPNLLELVESYRNDLSAIQGLSESATCDEKSDGVSTAGRTDSHLSHRAICDDDASGHPSNPIDLSLCADEGPRALSVCADEGPRALSVCADEERSDARLKTDVERVGTTVYGLPLYHFRYKTDTAFFQGIMAQDVLEVMPDAVVVGEDGYYRVNYAQLGIRMTRT